MSEKCSYCNGTGRQRNLATMSPSDETECEVCWGKGETGKCASCGEDELEGGICKYCGAAE